MQKVNKRKKGEFYEDAVVRELARRKYSVIERNFRSRSAEIDIIARQGGALVFVEVKARDKATGHNPFEAVDEKKQRRIIEAAKSYMIKKNMYRTYVRFDVAGVTFEDDRVIRIEIIKDAFQEK